MLLRLVFCLTLLIAPTTAFAQSAQFRAGEAAFIENCAQCHGANGRGGPGYANPIWGQGAQLAKYRTAAGLFEYHQLMMPFDDPTRMQDDVKLAITLYILARHGAVQQDAQLDGANAAAITIR